MTDINIIGRRSSSAYEIEVDLGGYAFSLKFDTGAKYTVISVGMFEEDFSAGKLMKIKEYCEAHCSKKERFISASGHSFYGYLVNAHNVGMDDTELKVFHYYLVVENQRDIALLGCDFIDHCKGSFEPHSDIILSKFDENTYESFVDAMDSDELIAFMDSLSAAGD